VDEKAICQAALGFLMAGGTPAYRPDGHSVILEYGLYPFGNVTLTAAVGAVDDVHPGRDFWVTDLQYQPGQVRDSRLKLEVMEVYQQSAP
jgi:hypothetical protein